MAHVRDVVAPFVEEGDEITLIDSAGAGPPAVDHPLLARMVDGHSLPVKAKLGWTDVARFAEHGIPAANFGPGDPTLAHTADERVDRSSVERCFTVLREVLVGPGEPR